MRPGARKIPNAVSVSLGVKTELFNRVVVPTATHGARTWAVGMDKIRKLGVMKKKIVYRIRAEWAEW